MMMVFIGVGIMNTSIQAKNADATLDALASAWEASNFMLSEGELSSCLGEGYELSTDKQVSAANGNASYATLKLRYKYEVPFLGIDLWRETQRSIR